MSNVTTNYIKTYDEATEWHNLNMTIKKSLGLVDSGTFFIKGDEIIYYSPLQLQKKRFIVFGEGRIVHYDPAKTKYKFLIGFTKIIDTTLKVMPLEKLGLLPKGLDKQQNFYKGFLWCKEESLMLS